MTSQQDALLYMPGATEGTTQWKVDTIQLVNWGGFHGYTQVPYARAITLLSGASGTGKSTLLDAYIALLMDANTPFNGASNDATVGRARSAGQRSLLSYLRGKTDTARDTGSDELVDQVLRGRNAPTWGALAVTFVDDHDRKYTVARLFYVPRDASKDSDLTRKMCTVDGSLNLADVEPFAVNKFDKRAVQGRFTNLKMHDTYGEFSTAFCTKLGIGPNGDGAKALRLLARIQAGHPVRTVDEMYKSLVLEEPGTYQAANDAVEHFKDLEDAYKAMDEEAKKAEVLARIPDLWADREAAVEKAALIDTFGIHRVDADTPLDLWRLNTEDALLEVAENENRANRQSVEAEKADAEAREADLTSRLTDVEEHLAANESHGQLKRWEADLGQLNVAKATAEQRRRQFDAATLILGLDVNTHTDFTAAVGAAEVFADEFDAKDAALNTQLQELGRASYAPMQEKDELADEVKSLATREGRMDARLDASRRLIAKECGIDAADLPFVGELIDVKAGERTWRKAIETILHGVARIMLIDDTDLDRVRKTIDTLHLPVRVNFQGVRLAPFHPETLNPIYVSGKLEYKDTPYTGWVLDRLQAENTDARCVDNPSELGHGSDLRVTVNGQTGRGRAGAHGGTQGPNVIGFSKEERLAEIATRVTELDAILGNLAQQGRALEQERQRFNTTKTAHDHVRATAWASIDVDGITANISDIEERRLALLNADDNLAALETERETLKADLKKVGGEVYAADTALKALKAEQDRIVARKDKVVGDITRIEQAQQVSLTDDQNAYLDDAYAEVATVGDLAGFAEGCRRLKTTLAERLRGAGDKITSTTRALEDTFKRYLDAFPDPNQSPDVVNYPSFRRILDTIHATGLHERRAEWSRRLTEWSGQDLVPLAGAFELAITDIRNRLAPVNAILDTLEFGAHKDRLHIELRELHRVDVQKFRKKLRDLSRIATADLDDQLVDKWFKQLRDFMNLIRPDATPVKGKPDRDYYLDVRKHIEITAVAYDTNGNERSTYAALGGKSGGETQELVAFIVGAALRFQLGDDEGNQRPRFAPVFLDEGFVKADSEFAGRAVNAWAGLGFQLIIGAPYGQYTALEPYADDVLFMSKDSRGYSHVRNITPTSKAAR